MKYNESDLSIFYPPTLDYFWHFQRPQQLMHRFAAKTKEAYFFHSKYKYDFRGTKKVRGLIVTDNYGPGKLIRPYIMYSSSPISHTFLKVYKPDLFVYDYLDSTDGEFSSWGDEADKSIEAADVVICTADKLYNQAKKLNKECYLIPNGTEFDRFNSALSITPELDLNEQDLIRSRSPRFYYHGAIASWGKWGMITSIAYRLLNTCSFIVVGDLYDIRIKDIPNNLHLLGHKEYSSLNNYIALADICFIPFNEESPMIAGCNPIKVWEYFSTGKPVVSTRIKELEKFEGLIYFGNTEEEFIKAMNQAVSELNNPKLREKKSKARMKIALENSWEVRSEEAWSHIISAARRKGIVT